MSESQNTIKIADMTSLAAGSSPYYFPSRIGGGTGNGLCMDGFDHVGFIVTLGAAANTIITMTVQGSDDSALWLDITKSGYETQSNTLNNASFICTGIATTYVSIDFDEYDYRYIRIKLVVVAGGGVTDLILAYAKRRQY